MENNVARNRQAHRRVHSSWHTFKDFSATLGYKWRWREWKGKLSLVACRASREEQCWTQQTVSSSGYSLQSRVWWWTEPWFLPTVYTFHQDSLKLPVGSCHLWYFQWDWNILNVHVGTSTACLLVTQLLCIAKTKWVFKYLLFSVFCTKFWSSSILNKIS